MQPKMAWRFTVTCSTLKTAKELTEFKLSRRVPLARGVLFCGVESSLNMLSRDWRMTAQIFALDMCCCCCCKCSVRSVRWGDWQQQKVEGSGNESYEGES